MAQHRYSSGGRARFWRQSAGMHSGVHRPSLSKCRKLKAFGGLMGDLREPTVAGLLLLAAARWGRTHIQPGTWPERSRVPRHSLRQICAAGRSRSSSLVSHHGSLAAPRMPSSPSSPVTCLPASPSWTSSTSPHGLRASRIFSQAATDLPLRSTTRSSARCASAPMETCWCRGPHSVRVIPSPSAPAHSPDCSQSSTSRAPAPAASRSCSKSFAGRPAWNFPCLPSCPPRAMPHEHELVALTVGDRPPTEATFLRDGRSYVY
jgi:hypothetical protein